MDLVELLMRPVLDLVVADRRRRGRDRDGTQAPSRAATAPQRVIYISLGLFIRCDCCFNFHAALLMAQRVSNPFLNDSVFLHDRLTSGAGLRLVQASTPPPPTPAHVCALSFGGRGRGGMIGGELFPPPPDPYPP
jgi:hypothetical protein